MLQGLLVTQDAHRTAGACLHADDDGLVGKETMLPATEDAETLLQAVRHEGWHPEMQGTADETRCITAAREVVGETVVDKIRHAL